MPRKSLAPGYIKIFQTTTVSSVPLDHVQTLGIAAPSWSGVTTTINRKSGAAVLWTTALGELITLMRPLFHSSTTFVNAELWRQDTAGDDPLFIATSLIGLAGTGAVAPVLASQVVIDFKGVDDSDLRFTLLETGSTLNRRVPYTTMSAGEKALVDYIIGATSWLYTRGNSFPVNVGLLTSKTNDVIRKQRLNL